MTKRKFLLTLLVCSTMALNSLSFASASEPQSKANKIVESAISSSYQEAYSLQINFRQTLKAPTDVSTAEFDSLISTMNTTGWEYNAIEHIFERFVNYEGLDVEVSGHQLPIIYDKNKTDSEGKVVVAAPIGNKLDVQITDPTSNLSFEQEITANSDNGSLTIDLDYTSMLENDAYYMLKKSDSTISPMASATNPYWEAGEAGKTGKRLHCNRFNGPKGDNKYWSHFSVQGLKNFVGSDCDTSASVTLACVADDLPLLPNHCEAGIAPNKAGSKEATCSGEQGLSRYFHFR